MVVNGRTSATMRPVPVGDARVKTNGPTVVEATMVVHAQRLAQR